MAHLEIPAGMTALRIVVGGTHYDIAVDDKTAQALCSEHGRALVTDAGLELDSVSALTDNMRTFPEHFPGIDELIDDLSRTVEQRMVEVPHLGRFEYVDRPTLDLGPVPRPRATPNPKRRSAQGPRSYEGARQANQRLRRRRRNKAARKARRTTRKRKGKRR